MANRWDNIKAAARAICTREVATYPCVEAGELPALVDRVWRPVAAELAAGLRDETGRLIPHSLAAGITAWERWLDDERQAACPAGRAVGR
jgi:hypothetical protein